jgi:outer membrane lipoprotein carrier protein
MRTAIGRLIGVLVLLSAAWTAAAGTPDDVAKRVQAWLDGSEGLTGRFEQRLLSGALGDDRAETGRLWILRPGKMRWDYEDPERKIAILRDGQTLLYLEAEAQAIRGQVDREAGLLTALLAGTRPIEDLFDVLPPDQDDLEAERGTEVVRLRPRDADGAFESVSLTVDRSSGAIRAARVRDAAGNVMDYRFGDLKRTRNVPDRVFAFEPPEGTEILGDH